MKRYLEDFGDMLESIPDAIVVVDGGGRIAFANSRLCDLFGHAHGTLAGAPLATLIPERFREAHGALHSGFLARPRIRAMGTGPELCGRHRDGREFPVEVSLNPLGLAEGTFVLATVRDISERRTVDELNAREEYYRLLFEASPLPMWVYDVDSLHFLDANAAACRGYGYTREEFLAMTLRDIRPREDIAALEAAVREDFRGLRPGVFRHLKKDGSVIRVEISTQDMPFRDRARCVCAIDVTERLRAAEELRESEHRFADMLANLDLISIILDGRGRMTFCNDFLLKLTGWSREEVIDRDWFQLFVPREVQPRVRRAFDALLAGAGEPRHFENEIVTRAGERRMIRWSNVLMRCGAGEVLGCASIGEDVTEATRAQRRTLRLNEELERRVAARTTDLEAANRELESFSYSVSHDLRAPLRAIEGFSTILGRDHAHAMPEEARQLVARVQANARRMSHLIDDLLALARTSRQALVSVPTPLDTLVARCLDAMKDDIALHGAEVRVGHLPVCDVDPGSMAQVFENLLSNALKYSRKAAPPRIEVGSRIEGDTAIVWVRDNGVGFDMKYAGKLFGVFQRLHSQVEFEGTGVGLAIVQRIVRRHGGEVWAQAAPARGATFHVALPLALTPQAAAP